MAVTKYESYYAKICENIKGIREYNEYNTDSLAFAHWYLKNYHKLQEQDIAEALIDGAGDLGIDSVIIDEENQVLTVMQYKFPAKKENIKNEIDQGEVLKTWNGFMTLISNERCYEGSNAKFAEFKSRLENSIITHFRICFVSYNRGIVANRSIVESNAEAFRQDTGSELEIVYHDRDAIANIYEKLNRKNSISVSLKYKQMQPAYNVQTRKIDSYVGFVNGKELVQGISNNIATIFDENIRLYEYGSSVNNGINRTATSTDQADMFYFYNNGIVFICDQAQNSPASNEIFLTGASVVNGCQTLNTLYNAVQNGKLNDSVYILVRVISIADYSERMRITEFLNSQTPIRDSYFIANHTIVRDLQEKLLEKGYFLERQVNEYEYMKEHGIDIQGKTIMELESVIQYYVGYWINRNASLAKRGKNALFDKNKIEELLVGLTADKVIEAYNVYNAISEVLTMYRKTRRNSSKDEFAQYIGVTQTWMNENINGFRFMNTGDIILLNAYKNLKDQYEKKGIVGLKQKDIIIDSIFIVRDVINKENNDRSIRGLGGKNDGEFVDRFYRKTFRTQSPTFSDPEDIDYMSLYKYNIMPAQVKQNALEYSLKNDNLIYSNSGLYCIEREIENFASKHSSYNKCQMVLAFLSKVINKTNARIDERTKVLKDARDRSAQELDAKTVRLQEEIDRSAKNMEEVNGKTSKNDVSEYTATKLNYMFDATQLASMDADRRKQNFAENDFASKENAYQDAKGKLLEHLRESSQGLFKRNIVDSVKAIANDLSNDFRDVQHSKDKMDAKEKELDQLSSEQILKYVINSYKVNIDDAQEKLSMHLDECWRKKELDFKRVLILQIIVM